MITRVQIPGSPSLPPLRFAAVSVGDYDALAVTTDGGLFTWGRGREGALGHGNTENNDVPTEVHALKNVHVTRAAAGFDVSLVLTRNGDMWSWGTGPALGHGGANASRQLLPKVIGGLPAGASVLRIAAGGSAAACVRADGTAFSWGKFHYSETGVTTPTLLSN